MGRGGNPKGFKPYQIENVAGFMFFTNWPDAMRIEKGDRRYMVISGPATAPSTNWGKAWSWLKSDEGPAAALHALLSRRVDRSFGLGHAPSTAGQEAMRLAAMSGWESWLRQAFEDGDGVMGWDILSADDVRRAIPDDMRKPGPNPITTFLRNELGAKELGQIVLPQGKRRLLAVRRHEMWIDPTTDRARREVVARRYEEQRHRAKESGADTFGLSA